MNHSVIDLSKLPAPEFVEVLDYERILSAILADLKARCPLYTNLLESDPAYKILEVAAYRELLLRHRINDEGRALLVAFATGNDLDQLGALMDVARLQIAPAIPDKQIAAVMESDTDFRKRIQLAPQGFSVAGSEGAYIFHTLGADARVLDASVSSPSPGQVMITLLSRERDGTASSDLINVVQQRLSSDEVRPLTDEVIVQSAEIVHYRLSAKLFTFAGPDSTVVIDEANKRVRNYVAETHAIGRVPTVSGMYAALHVAGVQRVELLSPTQDITISPLQAPWCDAIDITYGGIVE